MKLMFVFVAVLSAAACSNKQIYTAVQESQRIDCGNLPQAQYEDCMRELETPYDEYEQQRQEIVEGSKP